MDGSWCGEAVFEYIDDPLTDEEYLEKAVTDDNMRRKFFDRMDKEISKNKQSDGQTSDSFGKTGPGKFFIIINLLVISINSVSMSRLFVCCVAKEHF